MCARTKKAHMRERDRIGPPRARILSHAQPDDTYAHAHQMRYLHTCGSLTEGTVQQRPMPYLSMCASGGRYVAVREWECVRAGSGLGADV